MQNKPLFQLRRLVAALACLMAFDAGAVATGEVNFIAGYRVLQEDAAERLDLDRQLAIGLQSSFGSSVSPLLFDVGWQISFSESGDNNNELQIYELALGALIAPWHQRSVSPYLGFGVSGIYADLETGPFSTDDSALGYYARTGVAFRPGNRGFSVGFEYRIQKADFDSVPGNTESDYGQVGLLLGYRWGAARPLPRIDEHPAAVASPALNSGAPEAKPAEPAAGDNRPAIPDDRPSEFPKNASRARVGDDGVLRIRPAAGADVLVYVRANSTVSIRGRKKNAYGVWWYATASNGAGWILERDLQWAP